jgi:hypothetical protein
MSDENLPLTGSSVALIRCQGAVGDHQVPSLTWRAWKTATSKRT